jgi:hypothetical protein
MCEQCRQLVEADFRLSLTLDFDEPTPNLPLLHKVAEHIDNDPNSWNQKVWFSIDLSSVEIFVVEPTQELQGVEKCGTAACVAGWALTLGGKEEDQPNVSDSQIRSQLRLMAAFPSGSETCASASFTKEGTSIPRAAQELLGLTDYEAEGLFRSENSRADLEYWFKAIARRAGEEWK